MFSVFITMAINIGFAIAFYIIGRYEERQRWNRWVLSVCRSTKSIQAQFWTHIRSMPDQSEYRPEHVFLGDRVFNRVNKILSWRIK